MTYEPKLFHPPAPKTPEVPPYVFSPDILLAIDVAVAAKRPLLVSGNPGSGKTTLARVVAAGLKWRFLSHTVTSRTRLEDLQADVDMVRRLADAQTGASLKPDWAYLKPGVLWWAFDPESASDRGRRPEEALNELERLEDPSGGERASPNCVLLLDEIDKADPDLPNDLLEPLDRKRFTLPVSGRSQVVARDSASILLIMTTNRERDLPQAVLRRCVTLEIPDISSAASAAPGQVTLEEIADKHFGAESKIAPLYSEVASAVEELRRQAKMHGLRPPSTAEYVDTLRVLEALPGLNRTAETWSKVKTLLLLKSDVHL